MNERKKVESKKVGTGEDGNLHFHMWLSSMGEDEQMAELAS